MGAGSFPLEQIPVLSGMLMSDDAQASEKLFDSYLYTLIAIYT